MDSAAAITSTSATQPCRSASSTIRPRRGSTGRRASRRPSGVRRTWPSSGAASAPSSSSSSRPSLMLRGIGRLDERERLDVAEAEGRHLEDDRGQVGAQHLGLGEPRPGGEVVLGVEADAGARGDATAPPGALVGGRLGDRLDGQALHLGAAVVAGDPGRARVDDGHDARDGERGLRDVGGEHHAPTPVRCEHPVLLRGGEPRVEREQLGVGKGEAAQRLGGVADLPLTREEHEDVAGALGHELLHRVAHRLRLVAVVALLLAERPVAHLHRVGAARDLDDRRVVEVGGEARGVDRGGGDDELEIGPLRQQLAQVAEEEVDVEAPLVGLVDDDHLVAAQEAVLLDLGQQDAVGHHLDEGVLADAVVEADLVAHRAADLAAQLLGDALGHRPGGEAARLRVADETGGAEAELEAELGELRALARPGLPCHDHHLVLADGLEQRFAVLDDRQVGVARRGEQRPAPLPPGIVDHDRLPGLFLTFALTPLVERPSCVRRSCSSARRVPDPASRRSSS